MDKIELKAKPGNLLLIAVVFVLMLCAPVKIIAQQKLYIDSLAYTCDSNYTISIRTKNVNKTVAFQGTILWDTTTIQYVSISTGSSTLKLDNTNMNLGLVNKGVLTFLWYDNFLTGIASTNDSSLFVINFKRTGVGNNKTAIVFSNTPTKLEIDSIATNGTPVKDNNAVFSNGYIVTPYNYTFTGNGNWTDAINWQNGIQPPAFLSGCSQIIINPAANGVCILNTQQTISTGAKCIIATGKKLQLPANLIIK